MPDTNNISQPWYLHLWTSLQIAFTWICLCVSSSGTRSHFTRDIIPYLTGQATKYGFSSHTTATEIAEKYKEINTNKTVIVTGGDSGIGYATVQALIKAGCHVIMASVDTTRAKYCIAHIKKCTPNATLTLYHVNLADLRSIRQFYQRLKSENREAFENVTILINNAGIFIHDAHSTVDGFEGHFGTNFLGHYYLTRLFLHQLNENATRKNQIARVISVGSMMDSFIDVIPMPTWDYISNYHKESNYNRFYAYAYCKFLH